MQGGQKDPLDSDKTGQEWGPPRVAEDTEAGSTRAPLPGPAVATVILYIHQTFLKWSTIIGNN